MDKKENPRFITGYETLQKQVRSECPESNTGHMFYTPHANVCADSGGIDEIILSTIFIV
jgi:hypothetical protein